MNLLWITRLDSQASLRHLLEYLSWGYSLVSRASVGLSRAQNLGPLVLTVMWPLWVLFAPQHSPVSIIGHLVKMWAEAVIEKVPRQWPRESGLTPPGHRDSLTCPVSELMHIHVHNNSGADPREWLTQRSCSSECFFGGATDEFLIEYVYGTKASQEISSHQAAFGGVQMSWWWYRDKQGVHHHD